MTRYALPARPLRFLMAGALVFLSAAVWGQQLPADDRIRLAEAFRLSDQLGDTIWSGWTQAPFAVVLVTPEFEYLIRHPNPVVGFEHIGYDELLASDIYRRPRQFPLNLQATLPAISEIPVIVIGQPKHTASAHSTAWVTLLMHEHFHQLQMSQPGYARGAEALDLAQGDRTGMWMLNFPFPYQARQVAETFGRMAEALAAPDASAENYALLRQELGQRVKPAEARYAGFQLWQEGIARYTEIRVAQWAALHYVPTPAFTALPDYRPFSEHAQALRKNVNERLVTGSIGARKRIFFYSIGAAEGFLLDRTQPGWRAHYFSQPFDTAPYFTR